MNFEGEYSEHAVPFVDTAVDLKKPSTNTIIYGHNIRTDGQMFNILKGYKDVYKRQELIWLWGFWNLLLFPETTKYPN